MRVVDFIRKHALESVGVIDKPVGDLPSLEELYRTQWCPEFEMAMRRRMVTGFVRYRGPNFQKGESLGYDAVGSAIERLQRYQDDGNKEHLVDAGNLAMIEFGAPNQKDPTPRWSPIGVEGAIHARKQ